MLAVEDSGDLVILTTHALPDESTGASIAQSVIPASKER